MEVDTDFDVHARPRINHALFTTYVGRNVLLLAELVSIENMKMKIRTCDGTVVLANLQEHINSHLQPGTKVQVEGTIRGKNILDCNDFIVLQDNEPNFDMNLYNETVKLLVETADDNIYMIKGVDEHWGSTNEKEISLIDEVDTQSQNGKQNGKSMEDKNDQSFY